MEHFRKSAESIAWQGFYQYFKKIVHIFNYGIWAEMLVACAFQRIIT